MQIFQSDSRIALYSCYKTFRVGMLKRCSEKFHKIHRKTLVPESLFYKFAGLRQIRCIRIRIIRFLFNQTSQVVSNKLSCLKSSFASVKFSSMKTKFLEIAKKFASIQFSRYILTNLVQFVCWLSFTPNSVLIYFKFVFDSL